MPAERGQMSDGWLSANGFVGNRKNVHALIKEGWTSGSRVDLGVSPHLRRQTHVSEGSRGKGQKAQAVYACSERSYEKEIFVML